MGPMTIDNIDDGLHVIDVENDQEKSELQSIIDKLLIEKCILQKDIDKLVELQVENQILKSEKRLLEDKIKTFEEMQLENQTLKSEKQYMERKLEEKEKKFQELSLHCAQLQSTILNSKENEGDHPEVEYDTYKIQVPGLEMTNGANDDYDQEDSSSAY